MRDELQVLTYDRPVAVIGDIHGCSDLLRALLARLAGDMPILVAGDLCDRGRDTRGVLDLLVARGAKGVRGNHDEWFIQFCEGRGFDSYALNPLMGGGATLESYGIFGRWPGEVEAQLHLVPPAHRSFVSALPAALDLTVMGERYWLVHAGVPLLESLRGLTGEEVVPFLARTKPGSLLWPKTDPEDVLPVGRTVIMGHVPLRRPVDTGTTLAIDTGAGTMRPYQLTAVIVPERRFVTVG
jgi:serine/threonine protein phosphatase 1